MLLTATSPAELIEAAKELPSAPQLLIDLGIVINDPSSDAEDVTKLLKQDPALAARLIRMANSAVYARPLPVSSIEGAVSCIGFEEVHRLVGALASRQLGGSRLELHGISGNRLRSISLFTALLMDELAVPARQNRRSCYALGLLRSVGLMALEITGRRHGHVPPFNPGTAQPLAEWEKCHWGLDNCEAAAIILESWRLPPEAIEAVRQHYHPGYQRNALIHLLALAAGAAADIYQSIPGEEAYWHLNVESLRLAGLTAIELDRAVAKAQENFQRLEAALA